MNKKKLRLMITSFDSKFEIVICQKLMNEEIYIKRNVISELRINKSFGKTCQIDHFGCHIHILETINVLTTFQKLFCPYIPFWFIWFLLNTQKKHSKRCKKILFIYLNSKMPVLFTIKEIPKKLYRILLKIGVVNRYSVCIMYYVLTS